MDTYLRNIVRKNMFFGITSSEEEYLETYLKYANKSQFMAPHTAKLKHWFDNCRMFHEQSCDKCKYRFYCYTI